MKYRLSGWREVSVREQIRLAARSTVSFVSASLLNDPRRLLGVELSA